MKSSEISTKLALTSSQYQLLNNDKTNDLKGHLRKCCCCFWQWIQGITMAAIKNMNW